MAYKVSEENLERQRLLGKLYRPFLDRLVSSIRLAPEARCLDLGCGIGETTRSLAAQLPRSCELVGVEIDHDLVEVARTMSSKESFKVIYQQGDANDLKFVDESFDFVFARALLMHMEEPRNVLSEMLRVCKSGGTVAVQEGDLGAQYCYPTSWAYERLPDLWGKLIQNAFIGREVWSLFQQVGYPSANVFVDSVLEVKNSDLKRFYRLSFEATGPAMIQSKLIDEEEFLRMRDEFRRVENEADTLCLGHHFYSAWVIRS